MKSKNIIGKRVKQARMAFKPRMTQNDLASKLQVMGVAIDRSMVSKIENGIRPVSDFEVATLAETLRVPISWLYGNKG